VDAAEDPGHPPRQVARYVPRRPRVRSAALLSITAAHAASSLRRHVRSALSATEHATSPLTVPCCPPTGYALAFLDKCDCGDMRRLARRVVDDHTVLTDAGVGQVRGSHTPHILIHSGVVEPTETPTVVGW
jgi:hypothetical protein